MKSANMRRSLSRRVPHRLPWGSTTLLIVSGIFVASLVAQTPDHSANPEPAAAASSDSPAHVSAAPNYALEDEFVHAVGQEAGFESVIRGRRRVGSGIFGRCGSWFWVCRVAGSLRGEAGDKDP